MRVTRTVFRTPLIKFLGKRAPPKAVDHTPRIHPQSPQESLPLSFAQYRQNSQTHGPLGGKGSVSRNSSSDAEFASRSELPKRFQYAELTEAEIENINAGGAAYVF